MSSTNRDDGSGQDGGPARGDVALAAELEAVRAERDRAILARDSLIQQALGTSAPGSGSGRGGRRRTGMLLVCLVLLGVVAVLVYSLGTTSRLIEAQRRQLAGGPPAANKAKANARATRPRVRPGRVAIVPVAELSGLGVAALSPAADRVAVASADGVVVVVNLDNDQVIKRLAGHRGEVRALAFTPDGTRIVSGGIDGSVRVHSLAGKPLALLRAEGPPVRAIALTGDLVAVVGESPQVQLLALAGGVGPRTLEGHGDWVRAVAFSPDGRLLATGGHDRTIRLWRVRDGQLVRTLEGHRLWISALAFGPDGKRLASAGFDKRIRLWDVSSGVGEVLAREHTRRAVSLAFAPGGRLLASASLDRRVLLWDVSGGRAGALRQVLAGHRYQVGSVAFDPRGRFLMSASGDGTLRLWPLPVPMASGEVLLAPAGPGEVTLRHNTTGARERVRLFDEGGKLLEQGRRRLAFFLRSGPDDRMLLPPPELVRLFYKVADHFGRERELIIVSGYRSPQYNTLRTRQSTQVAGNSRHKLGQAIDFRVQGITILRQRDYIKGLAAGGVGFYADSQFVHMDVGPVRYWEGS